MEPIGKPEAYFNSAGPPEAFARGGDLAAAERLGWSHVLPTPRGSTFSTLLELVPERPSLLLRFLGPNSIMVLHMEPLGQGP